MVTTGALIRNLTLIAEDKAVLNKANSELSKFLKASFGIGRANKFKDLESVISIYGDTVQEKYVKKMFGIDTDGMYIDDGFEVEIRGVVRMDGDSDFSITIASETMDHDNEEYVEVRSVYTSKNRKWKNT